MYLEIAPSGGKWFRLKYRFGGKEKRISLGVYPEVSLKDARDAQDAMRKLIGSGVDPSQDRQHKKLIRANETANTFEAVAREWYAKYSLMWTPEHGQRTMSRFERDVFPWIGARTISGICAPELLAVLRRVESRGVQETAKRALINCGQVFRYAVATGRAARDISVDLRGALSPVKTEHFAATTQPKKLAAILRAMDGYQGTIIVRCAMRLMPLVFVRPGELRKAEWNDINLDSGEWRFIVSKTDTPHIVPLSRQAVEILRELLPVTGEGRFVFPSARSGERPMSDNAILAAMREMRIEKHEMTGHGFRAVARTLLDEELHFRPDFIEHQLAHAVKDPNGTAYNRTAFLQERHQMMQAWADYLDRLKSNAASANQIVLPASSAA
jgi:integrase